MDHPNNNDNNNNNNNQDDRGDKLGKRSVLADRDKPSQVQPHKKSTILATQLGYDVNVNQERSSYHQLGSNFTQDMQIESSTGLGSSQIPRSDSNAENPRNSDLVESRTQGEMPRGNSKNCKCKTRNCLSRYCECFAHDALCTNCQCQDCENIVENEQGVAAAREKLENKPTGFDSKGCTCKNNCCVKGYCVCTANVVKCTRTCKCINCKNPFGARDYEEITAPEKMNTEEEHNDIPANVPVEQQQNLLQCPNETHHGTMPMNVDANEAANTGQLIPFEGYLPNDLTAPSNNNNNNNNNNDTTTTTTTTTTTATTTITTTTTTTTMRKEEEQQQ